MYRVLARSARFAGDGKVRARLFDLGEYPGIVISTDPADNVTGEIYELPAVGAEGILRVLDDYEGIGPADPEPHEYRREVVRVTLEDGQSLRAWAYVLADSHPDYPRIPSTDYLEWRLSRRSPA
jgi:gamma-glutamylcyclotransferase (GGCT)/AIG2-like uncharacterized protein YtfP